MKDVAAVGPRALYPQRLEPRKPAPQMDTLAAPQTGWIRGQYDGQTLDLTFDRRAQSVSGQAVGQSVSVQANQAGTEITGTEGDATVDLAQSWQPTQDSLQGSARDGDVSVNFDWNQNQGDGTVGGQPFSVQWDSSGHIQGQAFGGDVDMQYDAASGNLAGSLGHADIQATITNLDLTDFMQHVYLLAP